MAAEVLLGRTILSRLVEQLRAVARPGQTIAIHAREPEHALLAGLLDAERGEPPLPFLPGTPPADAWVLRTDRLYETRRLRRALRGRRPPERAEFWRMDRPESLRAAEDELTRRLTYQPLGHYWAFPLAERLAAALAPTRVRPNAVTLAATALMLLAAGLAAFAGAGIAPGVAAALAMAAALVLDTADGRLARLQGTCTEFGRWLDGVLDELADMALHAAIAWSAFTATQRPGWLLLGMLYAMGKYLFVVQSVAATPREANGAPPPAAGKSGRGLGRRLVAAIGHADLRWHLWIVLAAVGRLEIALAAYAAYFPLRALGGGLRKAVARG
jgi:phosphatidylglycerophosphate synthase